ncbi:MAG: GNAT family N-acetyltransferase [Alcanivoracaceae bacterium]
MLKKVWRLFGKPASNEPPVLVNSIEAQAEAPPRNDSGFVMPFEIRPLAPTDAPALRQVFRDAIGTLASKHYEPVALQAWQASADDPDFASRLDQGLTLVATLQGEHIGFAQLFPQNHIEMLYLSPQGSGLGIATLLCQHLEDEARIAGSRELTTASSLAAQRFFESMGFQVIGEETVRRQGVALTRLQMRKVLISG